MSLDVSRITEYSKVFLVLAIVWYLMAFVSRRRRVISMFIYGIIGTVFLLIGIFSVIYMLIHLQGRERIQVLFPIVLIALAILVFIVGGAIATQKKQQPKFDDDSSRNSIREKAKPSEKEIVIDESLRGLK